MLRLLAKIWIPNRQNHRDTAVRRAYGVLCGAVGILLNLLLFALKLFAGLASGSVSVTADAFNNLSDALSSVVTLFGFRLAAQKADAAHPFGHGRIEYAAGFVVSMLILLMGAELLKSSVKKMAAPASMETGAATLIILLVSIAVKLYMFLYNKKIGRLISSPALWAAARDSIGDTVATAAVLIAVLVTKYSGVNIDPYCGALVAAFILYSGLAAAKETLNPLLGQAPPEDMVETVRAIVLSHAGVAGMHDLVIHDYGPGRRMVTLHAEMAADAELRAAHALADDIERDLARALFCEALIHIDPIELDDAQTTDARARTEALLCAIDPALSLHDFRVVAGAAHTKLVFDVTAPFTFHLGDTRLAHEIERRVRGAFGEGYTASVKIDRGHP